MLYDLIWLSHCVSIVSVCAGSRKRDVDEIVTKHPHKVPVSSQACEIRHTCTTMSHCVALFHYFMSAVCVQIIIERARKERSLSLLDKSKFLVPEELTMSQLTTIIRCVCMCSYGFYYNVHAVPSHLHAYFVCKIIHFNLTYGHETQLTLPWLTLKLVAKREFKPFVLHLAKC